MNYIGVDVHIKTLDFCAVSPNGKIITRKSTLTSVPNFIGFIQQVPKPRAIYIEESSMAAWLLETANRFNEKLIICDPRENHWIACSDRKNDKVDAEKLAQLARGNYIKPIHHPLGKRRQFKELVSYYHDTMKSRVRIKNKIKSVFRSQGILCNGETVYSPNHRQHWIDKLATDSHWPFMIIGLWDQLDQINRLIESIKKRMVSDSKLFKESKLLKSIPGIGPIHCATMTAYIETPDRFFSHKKLWKYAGYGLMQKESGTSLNIQKRSTTYNRTLKWAVKQAINSIINSKNNDLNQYYLKLIYSGTPSKKAMLILSRKLLTTIYMVWKKGVPYRNNYKK